MTAIDAGLLLGCGVKQLGFPFRLAKNKPDLASTCFRLPWIVLPLAWWSMEAFAPEPRLRGLGQLGQPLYGWFPVASSQCQAGFSGLTPAGLSRSRLAESRLSPQPSPNQPFPKIPSQAQKIFITHHSNHLAPTHPANAPPREKSGKSRTGTLIDTHHDHNFCFMSILRHLAWHEGSLKGAVNMSLNPNGFNDLCPPIATTRARASIKVPVSMHR